MSADTARSAVGPRLATGTRSLTDSGWRMLALSCCLVLTASYVAVLRELTRVVGGTEGLLLVVAVMLAAATLAAATVTERTALFGAGALAIVGFWYYFAAAGVGLGTALSSLNVLLSDTIELATGRELVHMTEVGSWVLAFVAAPVFLSWYLALRRRYALAAVPGGLSLGFLILTTDAWAAVTLVGTVAGLGLVAFGELDGRTGTIGQKDLVVVLLAAMVLFSLYLPIVPGGEGEPASLVGGEGPGTLEGAVLGDEERTSIGGSVSLSAEVRFTVESDEPAYWRTGVYDRFTGDEWVRTGDATAYGGSLDPPPGDTSTLSQTVTVQEPAQVLPAASQPVSLDGPIASDAAVDDHGQLLAERTLAEGEEYVVQSQIVEASPEQLRDAGTAYPDDVESRYLQLPEDTSEEFESYTADVTDDAENPYEAAVAIEQYLRSAKTYSLDVDQPDGNVAEEFLFEMDAGYCVYYATTMVQMLRAEEIPARYVTGYTQGQQFDDDQWIVRGLDAHAWVEVYFPGEGWVEFEPTPPADRDESHGALLEEAREDGEANVDTEESEDAPIDGGEEGLPEETTNASDGTGADNESANQSPGADHGENASNQTDPGDEFGGTDGDDASGPDDVDEETSFSVPPPERIALGALFALGAVAGVRRTGVDRAVGRRVRLQWQGRRRTPAADAERAARRLELLLTRRFRPRRPAETSREYLDALAARQAIDPRVREAAAVFERARYDDEIDRESVESAIDTIDRLARAELPVVGRFLD